ncbi:MAG: dicarboxylate/amino acid:cation symporter [Caulobacteraceae bacterium]|nr:dicarboxylate/amino acid:cation symporter [Caulobacteraceae bacterium]
MLRSLAVRVLAALALGLAAGAACGAVGDASLTAVAGTVEAVGGLWLNLLRMTIVPLVFCLLVTGVVASADAAATGRLATRALILFAVATLAAAIYGSLAIQGVLAVWPVDAGGMTALRAGAGEVDVAALPSPDLGEWLKSLAPTNPVQAAAESAMLPLVVFAMFFGLAATRLASARKAAVVELFSAIADTMITIVRWVLWAAPLGVFALSLGVGLRAGLGAAGSIAHYVLVVSLVTASVTLWPYLALLVKRGVGVGAFARAVAPVQALAFSTQSSLACLPAMVERAQDNLKIPPRTTGLVLPLAVAVFRITSPVANLGVAYFCAHVMGVTPTLPHMIAAIFVAWAVAVSSVGLPGQVSFMASIVPICLTLGVPVGLLPIFLAVEIIPDIFRTIGNVTADVGATALLHRPGEEPEDPKPELA